MISQDFGDRTRVVSIDVCKYAVEFSVGRNRLYNTNASGVLIEDVVAPLNIRGADLIIAYSVLEHLPDSAEQVRAMIDCLSDDGILIENYSGHSCATPHKSDTFSAYKERDRNLDLFKNRLTLMYGKMPRKVNGIYDRSGENRYWIKAGGIGVLMDEVGRRLREGDSGWRKLWRRAGGGLGVLARKRRSA
jgi:SAM-dependent methyltransferase